MKALSDGKLNPDFESSSTPFILNFWGKARPKQPGATFHPVAYHPLDVAAVGAELIERDRECISRIAAAVGMTVVSLKRALPLLLTLHDIGKFARVFQAKSPEHWPAALLGPYHEIAPGNNHVITGFQVLVELSDSERTQTIFGAVMPGWSASERKILFRALAGHHGRTPDEAARSSLTPHDVCDLCLAAAEAFIHAMLRLIGPAVLQRRSKRELTVLAVALSGLFVRLLLP